MFLADTNIFLEILLGQDKKEECKRFLINNIGNLSITDFSLHSIGVILFRYNKEDIFQKFVKDVMSDIRLLSLPKPVSTITAAWKWRLNCRKKEYTIGADYKIVEWRRSGLIAESFVKVLILYPQTTTTTQA